MELNRPEECTEAGRQESSGARGKTSGRAGREEAGRRRGGQRSYKSVKELKTETRSVSSRPGVSPQSRSVSSRPGVSPQSVQECFLQTRSVSSVSPGVSPPDQECLFRPGVSPQSSSVSSRPGVSLQSRSVSSVSPGVFPPDQECLLSPGVSPPDQECLLSPASGLDFGGYAQYGGSLLGGRTPRTFLPSEALLGSGSPHLSVAVRYNRVSILSAMVEALKDCDPQSSRQDFLDGHSGCSHVSDAGKTAVQLAVELSRPDCLLLLLTHGAKPDGLDAALQRLIMSDTTERRHVQRCLDLLLLFLPRPPTLQRLRDEPHRWQSLLGDEVFSWLCGLAPPPLLLQALRCLAQSGPDQIATLPDFLQLHSWQ
ncbi:Ankyrin repeat domain-containing protein 9 [Larimichthys crocea]|uniref:Ankyrin repeat domain-containing protein 9 n=1 Tax=Larimichthys crocea TaxID=215358 RepID=A0A6G0HDP4_LARCR|nr:Ankyrin repeat domain-containing protein 9 [Larimichthys crocea]